MSTHYDGRDGGPPDGRSVWRVAFTKRVRQVFNLLFALIITAIGVIALVHAESVPGRIFDVFVLAVGLAAVYLVIRDAGRRKI